MNGIKDAVVTTKSFLLFQKNQYTFHVESGSSRTEIKHWVELFFGVKVRAMNSHRLPKKGRRMRPIMGHTMHYKRMIIMLQPDSSILYLSHWAGYFNSILPLSGWAGYSILPLSGWAGYSIPPLRKKRTKRKKYT